MRVFFPFSWWAHTFLLRSITRGLSKRTPKGEEELEKKSQAAGSRDDVATTVFNVSHRIEFVESPLREFNKGPRNCHFRVQDDKRVGKDPLAAGVVMSRCRSLDGFSPRSSSSGRETADVD